MPTHESPSEPFREIRTALVCYGGVSLAIYMHGVTRELHRLVAASSRFDADQNPFEPSCTEYVYWEFLRHLAARDRVRTRVVVDVISGTSAGGINGVFLAKAIAHDLSQQSLRDLWFAEADIGRLLSGPSWLSPGESLPGSPSAPWFAASRSPRRCAVTGCPACSTGRCRRWTKAGRRPLHRVTDQAQQGACCPRLRRLSYS